MGAKLWFVTDGVKVIGVFDRKLAAEQEIEKYQDDPDFDYYDCYSLEVDELEDYPDEYDYAMAEGFLG